MNLLNLFRKLFSAQSKLSVDFKSAETCPDTAKQTTDSPTVACPYCGVILNPAPKRKKKCPDCGNIMFVREGRPVTEAQAEEFDERREFASWGISEQERRALRSELAKQWGVPPSRRDVRWNMLTRKIHEAAQRSDIEAISRWQWLQARQLFEEGRPHLELLRESMKNQLLAYEMRLRGPDADVLSAQVRIIADNCAVCQRNDGKTMTIAIALKHLPIPNERCENGWCACSWIQLTKT